MTRVKICGIQKVEEARTAIAGGAWAIGEVFAPSRRRISLHEAARINAAIGSQVVKVGVFVNASRSEIQQTIDTCALDMIQLHGDEDPDFCAAFQVPVIKAFRVTGPFQASELERWPVWACLFDTGGSKGYGGSGKTFNHQWIAELAGDPRLIIAGGLNPANVQTLIKKYRPMAVDVSSGVEYQGGGKNPSLVRQFLDKVKEANHYAN